jgi:hypothetical protein
VEVHLRALDGNHTSPPDLGAIRLQAQDELIAMLATLIWMMIVEHLFRQGPSTDIRDYLMQ